MKVIVIGCEGFIGKKVVAGLLEIGYEIWGVDLVDISSIDYNYIKISKPTKEFEQVFKFQQFDYCINAAGSGSVPASIAEPTKDFEANVIDTFALLHAIRLYNSNCKYIHFSSAAVYGNPKQLPVTETAAPAPVSPYGYHKWISEITCKEFMDLYKLPMVILRPFSAYGPGLRKQLIWDLYQKFKQGKVVQLFGSGYETRDFIFIDDIINILITIMRIDEFKGGVYNIGSGKSNTIKEVGELFNKILGGTHEILFDNTADHGKPLFWEADISKINAMGFKPSFTLEMGLLKTVQWINENG